MGKFKMVVTDLDGTLLRNDKTISQYAKKVIKNLRETGIIFAVATARPVRAVKEFLPFVEYDVGIFHNGAVILDGEERIASIGIDMPDQLINSILSENADSHIAASVDERLYTNFDTKHLWGDFPCAATVDFHEIRGRIAEKIIIETDTLEKMSHFQKYLSNDLYLQLSENTIAMIMNKQATKFKGIQLIAQKYAIRGDEIVAFGDDYNDIEMLKECGIGVAMENALAEVKAEADEVCGTNENDGVVRWLEQRCAKALL